MRVKRDRTQWQGFGGGDVKTSLPEGSENFKDNRLGRGSELLRLWVKGSLVREM